MAAKRGHRPTQYRHGIFVSKIKINHNILSSNFIYSNSGYLMPALI